MGGARMARHDRADSKIWKAFVHAHAPFSKFCNDLVRMSGHEQSRARGVHG